MNNFPAFKKAPYGQAGHKRDRDGNLVVASRNTRSRRKVDGSVQQASAIHPSELVEESDILEDFSESNGELEQELLLAAELYLPERIIEIAVVEVNVEDDMESEEEAEVVEVPDTNHPPMTPVQKAFVLVALLKWIKFHGTKSSLEADLKVYRCIMESFTGLQTSRFPSTIYQLHRELGLGENGLKLHYICPTHGSFVGTRSPGQPTNVSFECAHDRNNPHVIPLQTLSQSSLLTTDIEVELRKLLPEKWTEIRRNMILRGQKNLSVIELVQGDMYADIAGLDENAVTLLVHADGAKLAGSSSLKCYAIHLTVAELNASSRYNRGILHTVWVGQGKDCPHRSVLWKAFIDQMSSLSSNGMEIELDGQIRTIRVYVSCVIGDAMERFPLAGLSIFHAEFGCTRCPLKTLTWTDPLNPRSHHQIYPCVEELPPCRTDAETDALGEELMKLHRSDRKELCKLSKYKGGMERSPLHGLRKLDIIRGLPVGFMHLFLKGLFPKVLEKILSPDIVRWADCRAGSLNFPDAISRKPRSLRDLNQMKANEFCTFMIYGLHAVHELASAKEFEVLALLISLATTVTQDRITEDDILRCKLEGHLFVTKCQELWGDEFLVYNVHLVLHLHECLRDFGSMAGYCELAYEDWIGKVVKSVKGFNQIPREIANTLALRLIATLLMSFLQTVDLPANVTNLLEEFSRTKRHKISVELDGRILLGASKTVKWLKKQETSSWDALRSALLRQDEVGANCNGKVFDKVLIRGYLLSNRTSYADANANALFFDTEGNVYEFRFAVQYFQFDCARGPTFIVARKASDTGVRPFDLAFHLPVFSVIAWSEHVAVVFISQFGGVAVEMPYSAEQSLVCKLPQLLFRMD